ncbi:multicopper oxidase family protein [Actinoalloteichus hymeniacidonis]|uniref:Multicopper oxidase n=1 Tax=Actinoalloteichus hymeniacidonis TaxID=340345 RepID=A0AAC9HP95_9PSEU|nr:multicopper oxidase domain-containing protein [Actinoalloteichus hymeniacidonis]AOS62947.1 putative multicopper oxidase [Actinoalloteichus hymeniacidonis]MBB5909018.1 spore coat protein A [Actinoalloteichus hymeniacidonis]
MSLPRRVVLRILGGAVVALPLLAGCADQGSTGILVPSAAPLPEPFGVPLPIPPVLEPVRTDESTDYYEITQRAAKREILPGLTTEIWGYNGIFPGPTLVTRRGRRAVVRQRNELPVPVAVHLHGGVTPEEHDGYPIDVILPVGGWQPDPAHAGHPLGVTSQDEREYVYPLDQPACTLWYHDHRMDFTGPQVYRGLAGFHLVRDDIEDALPLPRGERDVPLMICDRTFAEDGSFAYPSIDPSLGGVPGVPVDLMDGVLGDVNLVNGAPWPYLEVSNTRYRFRILNAANARRYRLQLDPRPAEGPSFVQVGSDVGLLGAPIAHDQIEIASAERFDVVIDFAAYPVGTEVTLVNAYGVETTRPIMRFHVVREEPDDTRIPERLVEFETLDRADATVERDFRFANDRVDGVRMWTINGLPFDPERIDADPALGAVEIWRLRTNVHHPVHLHMAHFQVLTRNGRAPGPYDAGWKDTVDLAGGEEAEIIVRFDGFQGRYVFHCHNLEHEDMMMMANFRVR